MKINFLIIILGICCNIFDNGAVAQSNANNISCAADLNASQQEPTLEALLSCLEEMQREIEENRQQAELARSALSGMIAWFNQLDCPRGWSLAGELTGRYALGLPQGGQVGLTVGDPLGNGESRPAGSHTHTGGGTALADKVGGGEVSGPGGFERYPGSVGGPSEPAAQKLGTNAPYVQLLACRKD